MILKTHNLLNAIEHVSLSKSLDTLKGYSGRRFRLLPDSFWSHLKSVKSRAVDQDDQTAAAAALCLETVGKLQDAFVSIHDLLRDGQSQAAWVRSIDCEGFLSDIDRHFDGLDDLYGIEHVRTYLPRIQELYPPMLFASMGAVALKRRCGICKAEIKMRRTCEHKLWEIYDGQFCYTEVTEAELLHVALTDKPEDRRCIVTIDGYELDNDFRVEPVKALATLLPSPWACWSYAIEAQVHSSFRGVANDAKCPCGSDLAFESCHLRSEPLTPRFLFMIEGI